MLTNFAIGQYVPAESYVHRLDPRSKLLFVILFAFAVFMANNPVTYGILTIFVLSGVAAARISYGYMVKGLKPVWFLLLFTVVLHLLTTKGGEVYFETGWFSIHEEGVRQAIYMTLRIGLLVLISSLLTLTTSPIDLTDGLERLLAPAKKIGVPVHEVALMLSIALRFIPTLMEETDKIIKAQTARGADFESGNMVRRAKAMLPIVIPLFVSAFRRAEELALAMEARGYRGGEGRTRLRQLKFTWRDPALAVILLVIMGLVGWLRA
ncbi:energy-coupling factor transporter transmembrane component T family protein [Brevibacillus dissolubilis]|uniref:energy-coupling factor transporter transmembrane component T family protein n=1 Tax=Brevibacillus dissolubilis TaxID=1844116 RepID=UPI001116C957|nr:energy-coupling factor transporter transmembrane component T [Brevibacillus dissolubilis]